MTWWQNDPVVPAMDTAKATAGWWSNDPVKERAWSDVPREALGNVGSSAVNTAKNIVQPLLHPVDTAKTIGNLTAGVLSKPWTAAMEAGGFYVDPQKKAEVEATADAAGRFLADRYGSSEGIKKTLATDPVGALADASVVLSGGGTLAARAPGAIGNAGRAAVKAGNAIDPIAAAGRVAVGAANGVGGAAASTLGVTTGAGRMPIEYAFQAGKEGNQVFRDHMRGSAPITDVGDMAKSAVGDMAAERSAAYTAGMQNVKGTGLIDFRPIDWAINTAHDMVHFKGVPKSKEAANTLSEISNKVAEWQAIPSSAYRTAEGLDALKQAVGEIRQKTQYGTLERKVADQVYGTIRKQIVKQVPEYAETMRGYSQASDQIDDITKTFSLGEKASKDAALRKLTSVMRNNVNTNFGQRAKLMDEMAAKQPDLPYAIAGQALNSATPRGIQGGVLGAGAILNPAALPQIAAMAPITSPRIVGEAAYGAGRFGQEFGNALAKLGVTPEQFINALRSANQVGNALSAERKPQQ